MNPCRDHEPVLQSMAQTLQQLIAIEEKAIPLVARSKKRWRSGPSGIRAFVLRCRFYWRCLARGLVLKFRCQSVDRRRLREEEAKTLIRQNAEKAALKERMKGHDQRREF